MSKKAPQNIPCEDCGVEDFEDWTLLPHSLFNFVCPGGNGYLCFPCFVKRASSAVQPPNTESDKSIDTILDKIPLQFNKPPRKWGEFRSEIKSQLLAEILKGAEGFEIDKTTVTGYPESIWVEAIPTQYLTELFNEKEK